MDETTTPLPPDNRQGRPTMLTVLCILTFIWSGMNLFSSLVIAGFYDVFTQVAQEFAEKFKWPGIDQLLGIKPLFFIATGFGNAGSLFGAILMMRLKKAGFHVYTISQILLVIAPMYFMHLAVPQISDLLFSGLFILLYSTNLKFMT